MARFEYVQYGCRWNARNIFPLQLYKCGRWSIFQQYFMANWACQYRPRSNVNVIDTPCYAIKHVCQIWKNPFRTVDTVECFSNFTAKSWLNDLEDILRGPKSFHTTHPFVLVTICDKYGKTSTKNCRRYRADRTWCLYLSSWLEVHGELTLIIQVNINSHYTRHTFMLVPICSKYGKNPLRSIDAFEKTGRIIDNNCGLLKYCIKPSLSVFIPTGIYVFQNLFCIRISPESDYNYHRMLRPKMS